MQTIFLFFNSELSLTSQNYLQRIIKPFGILLRTVGISSITNHLFIKGKDLAKDLFGIPFETGQILTVPEFLEQYSKSKIATPLDNPLISRDKELTEIQTKMSANNIVLLKGPAGAGKSRLALKAIENYTALHPEYKAYCIVDRNNSIRDDLFDYIKQDQSYIIFIDDANRQVKNLLDIVYRQKDQANGAIKLIVTVRDYAKAEVIDECYAYGLETVAVNKLPNETIGDILRSAPYLITNEKLIDQIIEVSKGNPRLSIMAALVAKKENNNRVLPDAGDIYETYFHSFIADNVFFKKPETIKVLGLLSFFYTLELDTPHTREIQTRFRISDQQLVETIDELRLLELVDFFENTVKFTEQGFSAYFFYKAFFKDELLSFRDLFEHYFQGLHYRMRDAFESANTLFGTEKVFTKATPVLNSYRLRIAYESDRAFIYLEIFGNYFPAQVFDYAKAEIGKCPVPAVFSIQFKDIPYNAVNTPPLIKLLQPFYESEDDKHLLTSLELSLDYAACRNGIYKEVISSINRALHIRKTDIDTHLKRQQLVFAYFMKFPVSDTLHLYAFYHIFMELVFSGQYFNEPYYELKGDTWELIPEIKAIRTGLWSHFTEHYEALGAIRDHILIAYLDGIQNINSLVLNDDLPLLQGLIETKLHSSRLEDCLFVNKLTEAITDRMAIPEKLVAFAAGFTNPTYQLAIVLAPSTYRNKPIEMVFNNYNIMHDFKLSEIARAVVIRKLADFELLHARVVEIVQCRWIEKYNMWPMLQYAMAPVFKENTALGFKILEYYLKNGNKALLNPVIIFTSVFSLQKDFARKLLKLLNKYQFQREEEWNASYFHFFPDDEISDSVTGSMLQYFTMATGKVAIYTEMLDKYSKADPLIYQKSIKILADKYEANHERQYELGYHFFDKIPDVIKADPALCKRAYLQQEEQNRQYDNDGSDLLAIMQKDPTMLGDLIDHMLAEDSLKQIGNNKHFPGLWKLEKGADYIYSALVRIKNSGRYYTGDRSPAMFFININKNYIPAGTEVVKRVIRDCKDDLRAVNMALDIGRNYLKDHFLDLIKYYLTLQPDLVMFKNLRWHNNSYMMSADTSRAELEQRQLRDIYKAIGELPNPDQYFDHLEEINRQIAQQELAKIDERKMKFKGYY